MKHAAVLLFLAAPALVLASAGVSFLKIPVGPRVCGMGEAAVAYIDDASALFYNPAGLANVPTFDVLLSHNQLFLDMNHEYVAGVYGSEGLGKFGLAFDYWGWGQSRASTSAARPSPTTYSRPQIGPSTSATPVATPTSQPALGSSSSTTSRKASRLRPWRSMWV